MATRNNLVVGDWRKGIHKALYEDIRRILERKANGFRLSPYDHNIVELVELLDDYDKIAALPQASKGKRETVQSTVG